jgi:hypothetical protein
MSADGRHIFTHCQASGGGSIRSTSGLLAVANQPRSDARIRRGHESHSSQTIRCDERARGYTVWLGCHGRQGQ